MAITLDYQETKIKINNFHSDNLNYTPLDKSLHSFASFATLFDPVQNQNVATYGDGSYGTLERVNSNFDRWVQRTIDDSPMRAFFVSDKTAAKGSTMGIVNLGISSQKVTLKGVILLEGGALFGDKHNGSPLINEALHSVYIDYAKKLYSDGILTSPAFIYTVSTDNPIYSSFQASGLNEVSKDNPNAAEQNCILSALNEDKSRFTIDSENLNIKDKGRDVHIFYQIYDDSFCPSVKVTGETTSSTTSETIAHKVDL